MKIVLRQLILLVFLTILSACGKSASIGDKITEMERSLTNVTNAAGANVKENILLASREGQTFIYLLEQAFEGQLDKAFDELNSAQQEIFQNVENVINKLNYGIEANIKHIDLINADVIAALTNTPLMKGKPIVTKILTTYIPPSLNDKGFTEIKIRGIALDAVKPPRLIIAGSEPIESTGSFKEAIFRIKRKHLPKPNSNLEVFNAKLELFEKGGLFNLITKKVVRNMQFILIPKELGTIHVNYYLKTKKTETDTIHRYTKVLSRITHNDKQTIMYNAKKDGWKIDMNNTKPVRLIDTGWFKEGYPSSYLYHNQTELKQIGPDKVIYEFVARPLKKGVRAKLHGYLEIHRYKTNDSIVTHKLPPRKLDWNEFKIQLPQNIEYWDATIELQDGSKMVINPKKNSFKWFITDTNYKLGLIYFKRKKF